MMHEIERSTHFVLTEKHVKLAQRLEFEWDPDDRMPAIDPKHPYGNSDWFRDIAEITEDPRIGTLPDTWGEYSHEEEQVILRYHQEMVLVLQIMVQTCRLEVGTYTRKDIYDSPWQKEVE